MHFYDGFGVLCFYFHYYSCLHFHILFFFIFLDFIFAILHFRANVISKYNTNCNFACGSYEIGLYDIMAAKIKLINSYSTRKI